MKHIKALLFFLLSFAFAYSFTQTASAIDGLFCVSALGSAVSFFAPAIEHNFVFGAVSLVNVTKSAKQTANPQGVLAWFIIQDDDLSREWPVLSDIDPTTNTIITAIPVKVGKLFAKYDFTFETAKVDYAKEGDPDHETYKHMAEAKFSGYFATQYKAFSLMLNQPCVLLAQHGDGQFVVYGTRNRGINFKESHTTQGKREYTVKGEQNNIPFAPPILGSAVLIPSIA
jgi:hypothetical protein